MSGNVLIIEDNKRIANWVRVYFERAGFSTDVAHDGESGLALARRLIPDLVILDLMLPRLDGVELCRILRRESDVPIIMLTARETPAERIIGLDSGADDYIIKPFDPEEVVARARAVLRRVRDRVQQVLTRGRITLNETTRSVTVDDEPVALTQAQIALLSTFMRHPEPSTHPVPADPADLRLRLRRVRPRDRQPGRPAAEEDRPRRDPADPDRLRRRLQTRGGGRLMSLRLRIMGSIVVVIVLTILIGVGIAYYATQARLDVFVDRIGREEASRLARNLSREYTAAGGWETVEQPLSEAGYIIDGPMRSAGSGHGEHGSPESFFHHDPVRVVITDADGRVVKDNLSALSPGTRAPDLAGRSQTVFDLERDLPVGRVYVDVNHDFLSTEAHGFLSTVLYISLAGGALTAGVGILLAAWLSKRITAPVAALTEATQAIAQGDTTLLPVTSADELGRMSAAFNRMTSTLESQRELRRRLITDVSHELNTPLSVIHLEAKGLRDGLQTPEDASAHIIGEVDRLRGLVTDLNWLAETDHGELRLTLQACSVHELLAEEADRWRPQFQAQQVELSLQASPDLPTVDMDRVRISQALGNVLSNALRCTQAGGGVALEAEVGNNRWLAIAIIDNGMGIHAPDLPHIFDRFYRTDLSRSREIGGTGLGLAITRAIVLAHGGTVAVASDGPGQGTTVTVRLPLNRPTPPDPPPGTAPETANTPEQAS